jgi:hypothetical protein
MRVHEGKNMEEYEGGRMVRAGAKAYLDNYILPKNRSGSRRRRRCGMFYTCLLPM